MQKRQESRRIRDNIAVFFKKNTVFLSVNQLVDAEEQAVFWHFRAFTVRENASKLAENSSERVVL